MKALDEYFLMVVFTLLLSRVNVFVVVANLILLTKKHGRERVQQLEAKHVLWHDHIIYFGWFESLFVPGN